MAKSLKRYIGIITIVNGPANFGNMLQNYAVQQIFEKRGYCAETVLDCRWNQKNPACFTSYIKDIIHIVTRYKFHPIHSKRVVFHFWAKKHLKYGPVILTEETDFDKLVSRYDYCVVGSDQVWNPAMEPDKFYFASFMANNRKMALAPSIGCVDIPEQQKPTYTEALKNFTNLSVREYQDAELIKNLTNQIPPVIIDPTMMLTANEWGKICKHSGHKHPYLLVYLLGCDTYEAYITTKSQNLGLEIINLSTSYRINPSQFLGLIHDATYLITDSFHGTVFSLLFHKNLTIVKRGDSQWGSANRIYALLHKMDIATTINQELIEVAPQWQNIDECIEKERLVFNEFINHCYLK